MVSSVFCCGFFSDAEDPLFSEEKWLIKVGPFFKQTPHNSQIIEAPAELHVPLGQVGLRVKSGQVLRIRHQLKITGSEGVGILVEKGGSVFVEPWTVISVSGDRMVGLEFQAGAHSNQIDDPSLHITLLNQGFQSHSLLEHLASSDFKTPSEKNVTNICGDKDVR